MYHFFSGIHLQGKRINCLWKMVSQGKWKRTLQIQKSRRWYERNHCTPLWTWDEGEAVIVLCIPHYVSFGSIIGFNFNDRKIMHSRLMNLSKSIIKSVEMFTRLLHILETRNSYKHGSLIKKQIWRVRRFYFKLNSKTNCRTDLKIF